MSMAKGNTELLHQPNASLPGNEDVWVNRILPFVGPGHYFFVAGVCRDLKNYYKAYFSSVEAEVLPYDPDEADPAATFGTCTFCSVSRAQIWLDDQHWSAIHRGCHNDFKCPWICAFATKVGSLRVLKWALQKGFPWDENTTWMAVRYGHLECLQYARENGCPWKDSPTLCDNAARYGHLEVLEYVLTHYDNNNNPATLLSCKWAATQYKQKEVLEWLLKKSESGTL